jgi:L-lactate dehydrogenase complex protein LldG
MARKVAAPTLLLLKTRLREVGGDLHRVRGSAALARLLARRAGEPLWLEDHPWLRQAAADLVKLGSQFQFAAATWAPDANTVVTVGMGAIPETGSVLVSGRGPGAWLPFRARRHLILVPLSQAKLTMAQALELTRQTPGGLVTWLTGPTRTADIEKVLILGAQGPGELEVVIYEE